MKIVRTEIFVEKRTETMEGMKELWSLFEVFFAGCVFVWRGGADTGRIEDEGTDVRGTSDDSLDTPTEGDRILSILNLKSWPALYVGCGRDF